MRALVIGWALVWLVPVLICALALVALVSVLLSPRLGMKAIRSLRRLVRAEPRVPNARHN